MTGVVRLTLVAHATTAATAGGRFPDDEPIDDVGRALLARGAPLRAAAAWAAPERRTRETADALALHARVDPALADLDCGRWRGLAHDTPPPGDLAAWLTDPTAAPHGGESVVDLVDRMAGWLARAAVGASPVVAVTHPAVVRAALVAVLDAPPRAFWRVDAAPAGRAELHHRGAGWTLRRVSPAAG